MHILGLNWQLQEESGLFENGVRPAPSPASLVPLLTGEHGKSGGLPPENSSIDTGLVVVGHRVAHGLPPGVFWRSRLTMATPSFLKFNISVQKNALIGVYGRKGLAPSHTQVQRPALHHHALRLITTPFSSSPRPPLHHHALLFITTPSSSSPHPSLHYHPILFITTPFSSLPPHPLPHHSLFFITTPYASSPQPPLHHHALLFIITPSSSSPQPPLPHHSFLFLTTASSSSPQPLLPHHSLLFITTPSSSSPQPPLHHSPGGERCGAEWLWSALVV
ncbi:unnamed protein product [Boreogadus saida]